METSQPLSIESFSYSWLVSPNCSFRESIDVSDEASFIEMDPNLSPSKRFLVVHQDFDFNFQPPLTLVHADELISNGILVPLFFKPLNVESCDSFSDSTPTTPASSSSSSSTLENVRFCRKTRSLSLRRYQKLPKRIIQKYLDLLRPLWLRMRRRKSDVRVHRSKDWECSNTSSPRISEACSADNWTRRSCDSESSIYEAVLHCKRTIGCQ